MDSNTIDKNNSATDAFPVTAIPNLVFSRASGCFYCKTPPQFYLVESSEVFSCFLYQIIILQFYSHDRCNQHQSFVDRRPLSAWPKAVHGIPF